MENRLVIFFCLFSFYLSAQDMSRSQYIEKYKDEAIYQMSKYKIPASITLAQGILESANGNSELAKKSNNHFGIKCHSNWDGDKVYHDDDKNDECFRKYNKVRDSFEDHSEFLLKDRYADLFNYSITDYKAWSKGLKKAGYATDPKYAKRLIKIIEENELHRFDEEIKEEGDKLFYSGFSVGWTDLISQSIVYKNDKKEFYLNLRTSAAIENISLMFGGGKLLNNSMGVGLDLGIISNTGDVSRVDFKPNYTASAHFFIPVKQKQINLRISLSTIDAKQFTPSFSIGLLR